MTDFEERNERWEKENHNGRRSEEDFSLFETIADAVRPEDMMIKKVVSENDKALIADAMKCTSLDYYKIDKMIEQADSDSTKDRLERRRSFLYHLEEFNNDNL